MKTLIFAILTGGLSSISEESWERNHFEAMYAIIQSGSRQFRVEKGDVVHVDCLEATPGQEVEMRDVLLLSRDDGQVVVGAPMVPGCVVKAQYLTEVKGPKITSLKYKKRKNEYRKFGHRQRYAQLKIMDIQG
jgi:large subunit ribosomal protein L21